MEQTDILSGLEEEIIQEPATTGQRFVNLLLDFIVLYILGTIVGVIFIFSTIDANTATEDQINALANSRWRNYLIGYVTLIIYYTLLEGLSKGRSVGKLATRTRVVKEDGSEITFKDAFIRSLCRCIPFEVFSIFGNGLWHDTISKTRVVKM